MRIDVTTLPGHTSGKYGSACGPDMDLVGDTAAATASIAASPELIMLVPAAARSPESGERDQMPICGTDIPFAFRIE
ncbi:hypothetical protein AB0E67_12885 [Streptomyces sp. NPDC032161]|uniref:hypothetical protein n=1 Tax=unclassified Streptomyces TaxID=2593676 RepID=UPI0034105E45